MKELEQIAFMGFCISAWMTIVCLITFIVLLIVNKHL